MSESDASHTAVDMVEGDLSLFPDKAYMPPPDVTSIVWASPSRHLVLEWRHAWHPDDLQRLRYALLPYYDHRGGWLTWGVHVEEDKWIALHNHRTVERCADVVVWVTAGRPDTTHGVHDTFDSNFASLEWKVRSALGVDRGDYLRSTTVTFRNGVVMSNDGVNAATLSDKTVTLVTQAFCQLVGPAPRCCIRHRALGVWQLLVLPPASSEGDESAHAALTKLFPFGTILLHSRIRDVLRNCAAHSHDNNVYRLISPKLDHAGTTRRRPSEAAAGHARCRGTRGAASADTATLLWRPRRHHRGWTESTSTGATRVSAGGT